MQLDRRDFLKLSVPATGLIVLGTPQISEAAAQAFLPTQTDKAMLYDASKCVGCRACQTACRRQNNVPPESMGYGGIYDNPSDLSPSTWTLIKARVFQANGGNELLLRKYQCMHCTDAACVLVCPTSALRHHELGFVAYDSNKCSGCGYCAEFCPFQVPRLNTNTATGRGKMSKCDFCTERVSNNKPTACAEACPAGALVFGDRAELVVEGKKRVEALSKLYPNSTLYGASELGGLHVMYVLKQPPDVYLLPNDPQIPPVAIAWQSIIKPLGLVVLGLTIGGLALNYLVARSTIKPEKE